MKRFPNALIHICEPLHSVQKARAWIGARNCQHLRHIDRRSISGKPATAEQEIIDRKVAVIAETRGFEDGFILFFCMDANVAIRAEYTVYRRIDDYRFEAPLLDGPCLFDNQLSR